MTYFQFRYPRLYF